MAILKQILSSVWNKSFHNERRFDEIIGHDDIKSIFVKAILSKRPVHLLLVGSPGSAKTMFLTGIMRSIEDSYFIVGSNTTKAGLVSQLFEKKPRFLLIDELEKMNRIDQTSLLHLMETGIISETKFGKTREMELISWVFATANSCQRIIEPLLSRFIVLEVPEYTLEEYRDIAVSRLATENVEEYIAVTIADKVWTELGSKDVREVVKVARLTKGFDDVPFIITMMKRK
jgi:Holliday junction DNA helicase RuvB